MTVRERLEENEKRLLSPFAALSASSRGREYDLEPCDLRTEFQRDRDRIVHCKSFRRLKHKTQCFIAPEGDHFRTRLTHTLEVSQIARTIARALCLNEDLTEAISLGHDLGHTPFGHMGERTLARLAGHFEHNEQSLRVVTVLDKLNLTYEVRDGIVNHTQTGKPATLEAEAVSFADRIAYINHDIDDAMRAGVIQPVDLPKNLLAILGSTHSERINTMIRDIVFCSQDKEHLCMSPMIGGATQSLRQFMFEHVYYRDEAKREEQRAALLIESLYRHYLENPNKLPEEFFRISQSEGVKVAVCDHIASMTDRYAIKEFENLFIPTSFV